ncbi:MAG: bifunctional diaminohydroxyphosphoribosylaminopyrimidine deaminase/5-amino-6-(5-phosphoribosylamino)uracil reductase RibD [Planctomycetota bacterium]|nr:bifunctional diaminohydroxyphosphoribosylaminopyrimidine deaminase/5-amino-6-(5-phosphoribosylamino)uracil reductase RibD [Planctomycetota bacterium]
MNTRDSALMQRAFFEAAKADWLFTAPNPRVGALALKGGHVIGYGYYQSFGGAHAEENALRDAGAWNESTGCMEPGAVDEMVVTLEPCSFHGDDKKRPQCSELLLQAGVKRLLVGAEDPNPKHQGAAYPALKEAGVEVVSFDLGEQFRSMNHAFLGSLAAPELPWILLKWASSIDGRTATPSGTSQWITGPEARAEVHVLRGLSHAVMAGKRTVLADQPRLTARDEYGDSNLSSARVLVDCLSQVEKGHPLLLDHARRYWMESTTGTAQLPGWWTKQDTLIATTRNAKGRLDLETALRQCRLEHGIQRILVEGGSHLHGALLEDGLAHAVVRYEAPLLMLGGLAACEGQGVAQPQEGTHLMAEERCDLGQDLRRAFLLKSSL